MCTELYGYLGLTGKSCLSVNRRVMTVSFKLCQETDRHLQCMLLIGDLFHGTVWRNQAEAFQFTRLRKMEGSLVSKGLKLCFILALLLNSYNYVENFTSTEKTMMDSLYSKQYTCFHNILMAALVLIAF